jgi:hypothetical protein
MEEGNDGLPHVELLEDDCEPEEDVVALESGRRLVHIAQLFANGGFRYVHLRTNTQHSTARQKVGVRARAELHAPGAVRDVLRAVPLCARLRCGLFGGRSERSSESGSGPTSAKRVRALRALRARGAKSRATNS